jgi:hypothetical protein
VTDPNSKREPHLKAFLVLVAVVAAAVQGGCTNGTVHKNLPAPIPNVDRMALFVPENAITNLDGVKGPDGLIAQVMLFRNSGSGLKSVLVSGEVDVLIYEGAKPEKFVDGTEPFFSWTFTAKELAQRVVGQYNALWGYSLRLQWPSAPKSARVWLIARYRPPAGRAIYSSPAEQRMPAKSPKPQAN